MSSGLFECQGDASDAQRGQRDAQDPNLKPPGQAAENAQEIRVIVGPDAARWIARRVPRQPWVLLTHGFAFRGERFPFREGSWIHLLPPAPQHKVLGEFPRWADERGWREIPLIDCQHDVFGAEAPDVGILAIRPKSAVPAAVIFPNTPFQPKILGHVCDWLDQIHMAVRG